MRVLCQGEGELFSNSGKGVSWASLRPKWEEMEDRDGPFLLGRLRCFMEHLRVWVCLSGRCYVWVIYQWEKVKERATDFGETREQGSEVFQERRGSRAPALGRALKERALVTKGSAISQIHVHTHQPAGSWEDGAPQGAPDEVLGTPSSLGHMAIIKCPGCSNNQSSSRWGEGSTKLGCRGSASSEGQWPWIGNPLLCPLSVGRSLARMPQFHLPATSVCW